MRAFKMKDRDTRLWRNKIIGFTGMAVVLFTITSCKQNTFNSEETLWAHVKDGANGYTYEKRVGNMSYSLTYRPTDVLVKQELGENYTKEQVESLRNKYEEYLYFNLSMSANNKELLSSRAGNRNAFGAMVNQLAFGMADKVHLYSQSKDTVPMVDYVYPRMYGMSNSTSLLLVYPRDKALLDQDFFHFAIEDLGFATGEVRFKLLTASLKSEPKLNFKKNI